jgi:hypothetical protein
MSDKFITLLVLEWVIYLTILYILKKCINKYRARILFTCWENLEVSLLTLFCSAPILLTDGCGDMTPMVVSLFVVLITFLPCWMLRIRRIHQIWFGINKFLWRCRYWPSGYFATGCRLKTTWWGGTLFPLTRVSAWLGVGCGDDTPSITFLSDFCTLVESRSILDWYLFGCSFSTSRSFSPVHIFSRRFPITPLFHVAALVMLYLGGWAWTK